MSMPSESEQPHAVVREPGGASAIGTAVVWTLVLSSLVVGAVLCNVIGGLAALLGDRDRKVAHRILAAAFRFPTRVYRPYRKTVVGLENLGSEPYILCPNHSSLSDVVYLFSLPGQYKWIVKRELFRVPLFGSAMRVAGYPAIVRGDADSAKALVEKVSGYLARGVNILSFPEGSRSKTGELQRLQSGTARMAIANQVPLIPVGVVGTARLLPPGSATYPLRAHLVIVVGPPISTAGLTSRDARALNRRLREAIQDCRRRARQLHDAPRARGGRTEAAETTAETT